MSPNEFSGTLEFTHPVVRDVDKINCVLQCMAVTRVMALQVKNAPFLFIAIGLAPEKAVSRSSANTVNFYVAANPEIILAKVGDACCPTLYSVVMSVYGLSVYSILDCWPH